MANTTARASGVNRYFAGPVKKTTETKDDTDGHRRNKGWCSQSVAAPSKIAVNEGPSLQADVPMDIFDRRPSRRQPGFPTASAKASQESSVLMVWTQESKA